MEKLTLEQLAPYLPYGLPMMMCNGKIGFLSQITQNNGFGIQSYKVDLKTIQINGVTLMHGARPILRPLSDLTKEIEHNGERFVPMELIGNYTKIGGNGLLYILIDGNHWSCNPLEWNYETVRWLISWHFDIFGLIAAGLAVDINQVKGGSRHE